MKKNISLLVLLFSSSFVLSSCQAAKSPYDPYENRDQEVLNEYTSSNEEFHLTGFYPSDYGQIETPIYQEEDNSYLVNYTKTVNYEYTNLFTTVKGRFADFYYINFLAKGTPGKGISFRLYYGDSEDEYHNCLGNDVSFSLSEEYEIHSLKVKGTMQTRLDLLTKVCIYPEIGLAGSSSSFSYKDIYFSKTLPEGAILENPGVDSGDTTITVNGWKTEGWTMYTLYNNNGDTGVSYSKPADWAYIERDIEIDESINSLRFSFKNLSTNTGTSSVTVIHFNLKGDVSEHVSEGVEYEYDLYYEGSIYTYDLTKDNEVQPDENGITTLEMSLASAIESIGNHHENGYRLSLLIESHPDDVEKYKRNRGGEMLITGVELFQGEIEEELYSTYGSTVYTLKDKDGVDKNITYTDISGDAYWPRVCRKVKTNHDDVITITFKNNTENDVRISVHAGIYIDERSDNKNNFFYPLYSTQGGNKNSDGYYVDGQDFTLEGLSTLEVNISVDDNELYISDTIDVIELLIDSTYGDSEKRSGDIDIVSVSIN